MNTSEHLAHDQKCRKGGCGIYGYPRQCDDCHSGLEHAEFYSLGLQTIVLTTWCDNCAEQGLHVI